MNPTDSTLHWLTTALDDIVAFLPNLIAGLVILLVGWVIALVLAKVTRAIAHRLGFDRLVAKLGIGARAEPGTGSRTLGGVAYAIVMLVTVMQAARALRLDFVGRGLAAVLAYIPHVVAAALVFGIALYLGNFLRDRFSRARTLDVASPLGMGPPRFLPSLVRVVILSIGAFMALRELQIAPEIVNAAFMLTLGALAVAGALAFGLGGREVAGRIAQSWWDRRAALGGVGSTVPPAPTTEVTA